MDKLATLMPAYVEYLGSLPSLWGVVSSAPVGVTPVLYDDAAEPIRSKRGYVFRPRNENGAYERLAMTDFAGNALEATRIARAGELEEDNDRRNARGGRLHRGRPGQILPRSRCLS